MLNQLDSEVQKSGRLCLVVDASPSLRKVVGRMLRGFQLEVDEAENGKAALDKCSVRMPELILLDWNMPVMDGIEFLRALRKVENGGYPKVIFCTTESDVNHMREAFDSGANEYLIKPFDSEMLRAKIYGATA